MNKARDELQKIADKYEPVADSLLVKLAASEHTLPILAFIAALLIAAAIWWKVV